MSMEPMNMIPARRGIAAFYKREDGSTYEKEVLAFNEDGRPLVLGDKGLERADRYTNFEELDETIEDKGSCQYVSMIPGGGWMVRFFWRDRESGETKSDDAPVVTWAMTVTGTIRPLIWRNGEGAIDEVPTNGAAWHPDDSYGAPEEPPPWVTVGVGG